MSCAICMCGDILSVYQASSSCVRKEAQGVWVDASLSVGIHVVGVVWYEEGLMLPIYPWWGGLQARCFAGRMKLPGRFLDERKKRYVKYSSGEKIQSDHNESLGRCVLYCESGMGFELSSSNQSDPCPFLGRFF